MTDQARPTPAAWQPTFKATAHITAFTHIGSIEDCSSWCAAMLGREVWMTDADGKQHVVGMITETQYDTRDRY